jgi:DNA gyrase subunit A
LVSIKNVTDGDDLMIITEAGVTIRLPVGEIRMTGRAAQGVKLINLREDDSIASVARVEMSDIEDVIENVTDEVVTDSEENDTEESQIEGNLN